MQLLPVKHFERKKKTTTAVQVRHGRLSAFQRFVQQVFDGFAVKYMASAVALLLYAAPLYLRDPSLRGSRDDLTQDYIRSMRLLQNTSRRVEQCYSGLLR